MAAPTYVGTVRSFNPHKGWGFIECDESKKVYNNDVFLLKNDMNSFGVSKGDQVSFNVTQTDKGPRASNIKVLTVGPDGLQSFFGELKSFNPQKGFGFISSPASESIFGKDCFVLSSAFGDDFPQEGMHIQFKAKMADRGPVATEARILDPPGGRDGGMGMGGGFDGFDGGKGFGMKGGFGGKGDYGGKGGFGFGGFDSYGGKGGKGGYGGYDSYGGKGGFGGFGGGFDGGFGGKGGFPPAFGKGMSSFDQVPNEKDVFFGTIKTVNDRGFAHIACDAMHKMYNKDMFAHRTSVEEAGVTVGQSISFRVVAGPKGPHAVDIKPFDTQNCGRIFSGSIKAFNFAKGWGFISSPAAEPIFMSEVFLHKNELGGRTVAVGDQVQFTVDTSGGRASAKNLTHL
eukprot:TRINITY_DN38460_c0_g1_i1.p1 TRINITY_DN38460_c0_g1~~TRINITY_DN38460_c0_g1_i1.p1  ORF type:complete len:426 (-),score=97.40 TRINITY_DN38460_c0_g1_i1:242-1438(-)